MFYSNSSQIKRFRNLMMNLYNLSLIGNFQFIYFEDLDELRSIYMEPYHKSIELPEKNSTLILARMGVRTYYAGQFSKILQDSVNFRITTGVFDHIGIAYNFTKYNKNVILLQDTIGPSSMTPLPYRFSVNELFFRKQGNSYSPFFFLLTFEKSLWIYFAIFFLFMLGCVWIWTKFLGKNNRSGIKIFDFISLFLGNSIQFVSLALSYRIFLITFLLLLILFYSAFEGQLDALLATIKVSLPFDSIDELLMRKDYALCVSKHSQIEAYVKYLRSESNGRVDITSKYCPETNPFYLGWQKDLTFRCNKTNMAFFFGSRAGTFENYLINQCSLIKFAGKYFVMQPTFVTSMEFSFKEILNRIIIKAWTSGRINYITNVEHYKTIYSCQEPYSGHNHLQIEFDHCKLMILLFIVGVICAFAVLGIEFIVSKFII